MNKKTDWFGLTGIITGLGLIFVPLTIRIASYYIDLYFLHDKALIFIFICMLPVLGLIISITGILMAKLDKNYSGTISPSGIFLNIILIGILILIYPNFFHEHPSGRLTVCESNMKNIASALEIYATDNMGDYPENLQKLLDGKYMKSLPHCLGPEDDIWTYIIGGWNNFESKPYGYEVCNMPDNFTLWCGDPGTHIYTGIVSREGHWPQYNPGTGIIRYK